MSDSYPSFFKLEAMDGKVWLFAGYFMMDVVGWAGYPFNTATNPLSVRNELAYTLEKRMPSFPIWFICGVTFASPPVTATALAEKLSKMIIKILGLFVFNRKRVESDESTGDNKASMFSCRSSSSKKLNCLAKSSFLERDDNKLKQGLIAE